MIQLDSDDAHRLLSWLSFQNSEDCADYQDFLLGKKIMELFNIPIDSNFEKQMEDQRQFEEARKQRESDAKERQRLVDIAIQEHEETRPEYVAARDLIRGIHTAYYHKPEPPQNIVLREDKDPRTHSRRV